MIKIIEDSKANTSSDFVIDRGILKRYDGPGGDVVIPDGVTTIGDSAFSDCSSLKSITIPDNVTSIGEFAFYQCTSLTRVIIPDSVTSIGSHAFYKCSSLTSVTIGSGVTSIGSYAFYSCFSLRSVVIGSDVTSIDDYVFAFCLKLKTIRFNGTLKEVGENIFEGCKNLSDESKRLIDEKFGQDLIRNESTKSTRKRFKESSDDDSDIFIEDITYILDDFQVDYITEEELGSDIMYRKLITSVEDAERFNYHSDYWGDADNYQTDNVALIEALEYFIGDKVKLSFDDGTVIGTLEGILIDKQYNSLGHTRILLSDIIETGITELHEKMILASNVSEPFKFPTNDAWFYTYDDEIDRLIETNDPVLKTYCIVSAGGRQYASGVTGVDLYSHAYIDKETQQGWRLKSQARAAANAANIKSFHKKGRGGQGYGDVGSSWNTVEIMSIGDFLKIKRSGPSYNQRKLFSCKYFEFI